MNAKVLIVDDEKDLRELLAAVLGEYYDIAQADSGAALLKCFSQEAPDVVLLDVVLPDAHGLDLLPQIKKRWSDTEVIVLSGHGNISMAVESGRRGAYNFLSNPENHAMLRCPAGSTINAASNGPIDDPALPPTWNSDCASPCWPPEADRKSVV